MYTLLLKTEKPGGRTGLDYIGTFSDSDDAIRQFDKHFKLSEASAGTMRMLSSPNGSREPYAAWQTNVVRGVSYILIEL